MSGRGGVLGLVGWWTRRLLAMAVTLWLVASATFLVVQLAPGSYADQIDHPRLTEPARALIRARYGLDQPPTAQYLRWLGGAARGELGVSFLYQRPVDEVIADALPPTILLAGTALVLDLLLGIALAVITARRPGSWLDRLLGAASLGLYALPSFWVGGVVVLVFAVWLDLFPSSHMASVGAIGLSPWGRVVDLLHHLALPALCLGTVGAAATARYLRAALLDLGRARFILAARARGLSARRVFWVHTLRPALLPVVTLVGLSLPALVSGAVVVETIFAWPGMGSLVLGAALARDIPLIMAATLVGAAAVVVGSLVADLLAMVVDPRLRSLE